MIPDVFLKTCRVSYVYEIFLSFKAFQIPVNKKHFETHQQHCSNIITFQLTLRCNVAKIFQNVSCLLGINEEQDDFVKCHIWKNFILENF